MSSLTRSRPMTMYQGAAIAAGIANTSPKTSPLIVYVPLVIHGREKYQFEAETVGVFQDMQKARHALVDKLIDIGFISYDMYCDTLDLADEVADTENTRLSDDELGEDEPSFRAMIKEKATTDADLHKLCDTYGNSYYNEGWKWSINKHTVL